MPTPEPIAYTPATLNQVLRVDVQTTLREIFASTKTQLEVRGRLGDLKPNQYRRFYAVPLTYADQTVRLNIDKSEVDRAKVQSGDYVKVIGCITVDNPPVGSSSMVDFRLDVTTIELVESPEEIARQREERLTLDHLRSVRYKRNPFPEGPLFSVSVIHAISAQALVYEDFKDQVKPVMHVLEVEWLPTDLLNASAIAQRIGRQKGISSSSYGGW